VADATRVTPGARPDRRSAVFTGIVEELGEVEAVEDLGDSVRLTVRGPRVTGELDHGDSLAVNGVCLTVAGSGPDTVTFDVMRETLTRSALGDLLAGSPVNLERAMRLDARLSGHLVQGHVDGTGHILDRVPSEHWELVRFSLPEEVARYVVPKGSITVDGVSLTVAELGPDNFTVSLIPTTLAVTTLGSKRPGDPVNLEADVVAKYVERLLGWREVAG
jgi:riboflavin synthase